MNRTISGFINDNFKQPRWYVLMYDGGSWTPEAYRTEEKAKRAMKSYYDSRTKELFRIDEWFEEELPERFYRGDR